VGIDLQPPGGDSSVAKCLPLNWIDCIAATLLGHEGSPQPPRQEAKKTWTRTIISTALSRSTIQGWACGQVLPPNNTKKSETKKN